MWQRKDPDVPLENINKVLGSRAVKNSLVSLVLTGGEPTLREDLPEIFQFAFDNLSKLRYSGFFTNSLAPTKVKETALRALIYKEWSGRKDISFTVSLSLDGIGKTHNIARGVDGAFGHVMENYLQLKTLSERYKFNVNFNCTVQRTNLIDGGALALLEAAESARIPVMFPIVYGKDVFLNRDNAGEWSIHEDAYHQEAIRFYEVAAEKADKGRLLIDNGSYYEQVLMQLRSGVRTLPCLYRDGKACVIDADGSVYLCEVTRESRAGNIREKSFDEIWDSKERELAYARMITHCANCFSSCIGSGRYQLNEAWRTGGIPAIVKISFREVLKRFRKTAWVIGNYRNAIIPKL
jgi:radical SAM protein with 4Fe4S-binding SPASM domain